MFLHVSWAALLGVLRLLTSARDQSHCCLSTACIPPGLPQRFGCEPSSSVWSKGLVQGWGFQLIWLVVLYWCTPVLWKRSPLLFQKCLYFWGWLLFPILESSSSVMMMTLYSNPINARLCNDVAITKCYLLCINICYLHTVFRIFSPKLGNKQSKASFSYPLRLHYKSPTKLLLD